MKNSNTAWCCGPQDCRYLDEAEVSQDEHGKWFVNGKHVPNVYPSEDHHANYSACFRGVMSPDPDPVCLFIPALF